LLLGLATAGETTALGGRRWAKDLALCLQPVIQRMAGLLAPQLEQAISPSASKFKRAVGRDATFTGFTVNLP